jgi:alkanesulfonate monooxygenase SsuD/methylene tetrahydromethanopterin reductase-like flavin-dependent oxidoreductase (luciferase family)
MTGRRCAGGLGVKVWFLSTMSWPHRPVDIPDPFPGYLFDRKLAAELYQDYLSLFRRADELGYEGIFIAEHHYARTGTGPSPNLMAAVVATHTERARIGLLGNVLPLHAHPVRLAEELAMIDVLSGGRLVSGFLRGNTREYRAYGIDIARSRGMFEEAWDLIVKAWTADEPFAWHGEHYHYDVVSILPRPLQQPHPPILATANSAESIEWAARHHVPMMTGFSPTHQVADTCTYFRKFAAEQCGWTPAPADMGINRHVYVAKTDAIARAEAEEFMYDYYHVTPTTAEERQAVRSLDAARNTERSFSYKAGPHIGRPSMEVVDYERLLRDGFCIVGSPDTVTQCIREQERMTGAGVLVMYLPWGNMTLAQASQSLELFAKEVLPNLAD